MFGNLYMNLDEGLSNCFFEWDFSKTYFYSGENYRGYRMNINEDICLLGKRQKILKETYLEVETLTNYIKNPKSLNADNVTIDRI